MESSWDNTSTILEKNKEGGRGITVANSYRELKHALVAASAFRSAVHLRLALVPITVTDTFSAQNTFDFQSRSLSLSPTTSWSFLTPIHMSRFHLDYSARAHVAPAEHPHFYPSGQHDRDERGSISDSDDGNYAPYADPLKVETDTEGTPLGTPLRSKILTNEK